MNGTRTRPWSSSGAAGQEDEVTNYGDGVPDEPARNPEDRLSRSLASRYADPPRRIVVDAGADDPSATDGIDVYRGADHWRLVTVDLRALTGPAPADPDATLLDDPGHELSIVTPATAEPPAWAILALVGTARMCATVGRWLHPGARLGPGTPVDGGESGLVAWGVWLDDLTAPGASGPPTGERAGTGGGDGGAPTTPIDDDGRDLLLLVGVTAGEYRLMQRVGTDVVLDRLRSRDGHLRTDPARR